MLALIFFKNLFGKPTMIYLSIFAKLGFKKSRIGHFFSTMPFKISTRGYNDASSSGKLGHLRAELDHLRVKLGRVGPSEGRVGRPRAELGKKKIK